MLISFEYLHDYSVNVTQRTDHVYLLHLWCYFLHCSGRSRVTQSLAPQEESSGGRIFCFTWHILSLIVLKYGFQRKQNSDSPSPGAQKSEKTSKISSNPPDRSQPTTEPSGYFTHHEHCSPMFTLFLTFKCMFKFHGYPACICACTILKYVNRNQV